MGLEYTKFYHVTREGASFAPCKWVYKVSQHGLQYVLNATTLTRAWIDTVHS